MDSLHDIINQIELHSVEGINKCFSNGTNPNDYFRGEPLIYELTSEYTRTPRFKDCVQAFVNHGLKFDDKVLLSVLLDDPDSLNQYVRNEPQIVAKKYTLRCAYTPMDEVSLLHICAEFNHHSCAKVLVNHGADINFKAGLDEYGFGGQTPIFHTVNQNGNNSSEMMEFLLSKAADLGFTVRGILWGKSYEWETLIPSVNPISYAMMGMLPQMHRNDLATSKVVSRLLRHHYGLDYVPSNVPCAYLK